MRIYLIRHGETDWNKELRLQGREDIPLNECGKEQAKACGAVLKGIKADVIVSSPLQRAKDTADIIREQMQMKDICVDYDIIEREFGEASGITYQEKMEKYGHGPIPGFESNESLNLRMKRAISKYSKRYPNGTVIMVSHGGCINSTISFLSNGELGTGKTRLKNASISVIEANEKEQRLIDYNLEASEFSKKYLMS